jgi:subtilisin family serine protease
MNKGMKKTKKFLSSLALSAMLFNTALPPSLTLVHATANPSQQELSRGTFNAEEVNRILASLTPEQKANINKLTGAENTQKIHVESKDLRSSENINVIVQFKVDPAKIQIIKQSLANGIATINNQELAAEFADAQKKVKDSHTKFKNFVNQQPKTQIIGGKPINSLMSITREYTEAFNGVALTLPANQVSSLAENEEVASVWSVETFETTEQGSTANATETNGLGKPTSALKLLGLDKLQAEGHTGIIKSGPNAGHKVKVGVLDTGIDYNHPDLYKATHDANGNRYGGHDFVNHEVNSDGSVTFVDDNDPMETIYSDWLEAKAKPSPIVGPAPSNYKSYITSHGTHVSGTIAANTTNNNATYSANGVAPDVELHGYRVLGPGGRGYSDGILYGIDQSVKDGMQVINLSLGSRNNDPLYPTSIAINNATLAGVTCIVSAGNAGPGAATVGSPGSAALAVTIGASTIPVEIPVMTITNGTTPYQARLFGKNFADNDDAFAGQTFPIVDVGLGSEADYSGKDMTGKIALVKRGGDLLTTKMANAKNAGAKGMIIWNNNDDLNTNGYPSAFLGVNMDNIYSISLTQAQGQALSSAITSDPDKATITFPSTLDTPIYKNADELADFSSTGPLKNWDMKPDVISPGVDIISTVPFDVWEPQEGQTHDYTYAYESMSGTSMAAPHTSGIAALILAAHPDYSPADIKAALMNTAKDINTDSKTYSVYQVGSGRVDPARAIHADVKIQVLDTTFNYDDPRYIYADNPTIKQIDHLTGSIFFGFKGRGEGATNGSDDVVSSKDFNVINQGTISKTFNVSTKFMTTKFAGSNEVGPGTGNDVKIDVSVNNVITEVIEVGGGSTVKATAKMTVPSNALEGTYEGYMNLVNSADSTESYRIPFTITVAEKGIDFKVDIKAMTLGEKDTGNWHPQGGAPTSGYTFSVKGAMENNYILLKDSIGNYLGVVQNVSNISAAGPGARYGPYLMLLNGYYLPFTKPYNGSLDQSGIATTPATIKEGAYALEMIATDAAGKHYSAEDTLYVDIKAPTITMDSDSMPGIYEIDPTGYQPGQEIKGFYGTIYDSNVEVMKNNGETSVPNFDDPSQPKPVDQALNMVWGYQDSTFPTVIFRTDAKGRFHFGLAPEDVTPQGSNFWIYPSDYSGAGDVASTTMQYYFIKKGSPYLTFTASGGVNPEQESQGKVVVEPNKPFKMKVALKNGIGMTGGTFTFDGYANYTYTNIKLTDEYKLYLASKGVTEPNLTLTGNTVTISEIDANGALDRDMEIIEADMTMISPYAVVGPVGSNITNVSFELNGNNTEIPAFQANWPYIKQPTSMITGGLFAEAFKQNTLSGAFTNITVESGAKVTVKDTNDNSYATDNPTTPANTVQYQSNQAGTYAATAGVSDKPYSLELSMPGHFKGYLTTPVIGSNKYGYQSGS